MTDFNPEPDDRDSGRGWCPKCGRELYGIMRNGYGQCPVHKRVAAEWEPPAEDDERSG